MNQSRVFTFDMIKKEFFLEYFSKSRISIFENIDKIVLNRKIFFTNIFTLLFNYYFHFDS